MCVFQVDDIIKLDKPGHLPPMFRVTEVMGHGQFKAKDISKADGIEWFMGSMRGFTLIHRYAIPQVHVPTETETTIELIIASRRNEIYDLVGSGTWKFLTVVAKKQILLLQLTFPRQSGKTTAIDSLAKPGDLIIRPNMNPRLILSRKHVNVSNGYNSFMIQSCNPANTNTIWIDEPQLLRNGDFEKILGSNPGCLIVTVATAPR